MSDLPGSRTRWTVIVFGVLLHSTGLIGQTTRIARRIDDSRSVELVGHIPFGGGLIPKAAIAYAGTRVAGMSLERYYREGKGFSSQEQRIAYERALEKGKVIAQSMLDALKRPQQKMSG